MTGNGYELVIPTSHGYGAALQVTLELLSDHWPEHPDAAVICRERAPDLDVSLRARCYVAGLQSRVSWCSALLWYLNAWCQDEIILLLLDDYGLCGPPDLRRLHEALTVIQQNPNVASFHLTHMVVHPCRPTNYGEGIEAYPAWEYRINTQASFWRVGHLKRFLEDIGSWTIAEFEILGSGHWNKNWPEEIEHLTFRSPPGTPYILDTDPHKLNWVIPYDNLVHQGRWEQRHRAVLRELGIDPEKPLV